MPAQALVHNRGIAQHPPRHRGVVHAEAALRHHFLEISIAERIPKVPANAQQDDFVSKVSSVKQRGPVLRQRSSPNPITVPVLRQIPIIGFAGNNANAHYT
jgi:hypothetical protein